MTTSTFTMMRGSLWPLGLATAFLTTIHHTVASKAVNVALQASFRSPPYLLELLLVTMNLPYLKCKSLSYIEKQLQRKIQRLTSLCWIESRKDVSSTAIQTRTFTSPLYRSFRMTGTSQTPKCYLPFNLLCQYILRPLGLRHIISTMTPLWSKI